MGQAPADIVVAGDGQRVVDHVGLGLCESLIAGVGVVHDGVGCVDQVGELFKLVYQLLLVIGGILRHQLDVGVVDGIVGVGVVQDLLTHKVDGVAEVCAPAVDDEAVELGDADFLCKAGNVGAEVQLDEVVAEAVGEALLQNGGVVLSHGVAGHEEEGSLDRESDADGGQLIHGLLLESCDGVGGGLAQMDHGLAVILLAVDAQLLGHQINIIGAFGVVADALHGVVVVLTLEGVDLVEACVVGNEVQALLEAAAECPVGHGLVPVLVGGAVGVEAVEVEMEVVGVLGGALLTELVVVGVGSVGGDGGQGALAQLQLVQLTVLIQLVAHGQVGDHAQRHALEAAALVSCIIMRVRDEPLGVVGDEFLDEVGAAAPLLGVVHAAEALDAQLFHQSRGCRIAADVGSYGVEVGAGIYAGVDDGVVVRCIDADACGQHIVVGQGRGGCVVHRIGLVVVIGCAHDGGGGHGGVGGLILLCVQHPLEAHEEVFAGQVVLHLAVHVHPVHVVTEVERPDSGVLVVLPALSQSRHRLAVVVEADKTVDDVGRHVEVDGLLAVEHIPALDLTAGSLVSKQLAQALAGSSCTGRSRRSTGCGAGRRAAAGSQQTGCANSAGALEEAAAGDGVRLKIVVHILSLL